MVSQKLALLVLVFCCFALAGLADPLAARVDSGALTDDVFCVYYLHSNQAILPAYATQREVWFSATAGCGWTASSDSSWLTILSATSGTGNATLTFSVTANPDASPRTGYLTIAGRTFTVVQSSASCAISVSPMSVNIAVGGGTAQLTATGVPGCIPMVESIGGAMWLEVSGSYTATGVSYVYLKASANTSSSARSTYIVVNGQHIDVAQDGIGCSYSFTPASPTVPYTASTGQVAITTGTGCSWTAVSQSSWITITSGSSGSGSGTLTYSTTASTDSRPRTGQLDIAGNTITITQAAIPTICDVPTVTPTSLSVPATGGNGQVLVSYAGGSCNWTAASNTSWLSIVGMTSFVDNNVVNFTAAANTATTARSGTLTVAGKTITVTQAAAPVIDCTATLSEDNPGYTSTGGWGLTQVRIADGCSWTATSSVSWITIRSISRYADGGDVTYWVDENTGSIRRTGTLSIAGKTLVVGQDPPLVCSPKLSTYQVDLSSSGGMGQIALTVNSACQWTASSGDVSWLTINSYKSGSGSATIVYNASANSGAARSTTLIIDGLTVVVNQAGTSSCSATFSPSSGSVPAYASSSTVAVSTGSGCTWTATSNTAWLTITSGSSGKGNATVTYSAAANTTSSARTGTLTIAGKTYIVTQASAGGSCTPTLSATSLSLAAAGGTASVSVTSGSNCSWTASSSATWLTITSGSSGTGNGTVTYSATANTSTASRVATLTIGGQTVTVTQAGTGTSTGCAVTLDASSFQFPAGGGAGRIWVTADAGCVWSASSGSSAWLAVTSGASGSGPGYVDYEVSTNAGATPRLAKLTIANQTFTVRQAEQTTCPLTLAPTAARFGAAAAAGKIQVSATAGCTWSAFTTASWITFPNGATGSGAGPVSYAVAAFTGTGSRTANISVAGATYQVTQLSAAAPALHFVPVTPCRLMDTRVTGSFGGASFAAGESRSINIPNGGCSIPTAAAAYSLNVAAVPQGALAQLTLYPAGIPRPETYTLLSPDGRIKSTATVIPAGNNSAIELYASDATDIVLDINGYFTADSTALSFYPVTPCRLVDTRNATGPLGGPAMAAGSARTFPIRGVCELPATAQAYSVNIAAVPAGSLGYLTAWPTGVTQPLVASLNAPTGAITSNAAIVPAGTNGSINLYANDATDVVLDVNGYFAPTGAGGLSFYTVPPCRAADATLPAGERAFALLETNCALPAAAQAYALSATAKPITALGYLTLWPTGVTQPLVATLNASDGAATSNAALVPAGAGNELSAYLTDQAQLILDFTGYFAP